VKNCREQNVVFDCEGRFISIEKGFRGVLSNAVKGDNASVLSLKCGGKLLHHVDVLGLRVATSELLATICELEDDMAGIVGPEAIHVGAERDECVASRFHQGLPLAILLRFSTLRSPTWYVSLREKSRLLVVGDFDINDSGVAAVETREDNVARALLRAIAKYIERLTARVLPSAAGQVGESGGDCVVACLRTRFALEDLEPRTLLLSDMVRSAGAPIVEREINMA